ARDLKKKPVHLLGAAEACYHTNAGVRDLTNAAPKQCGQKALERACVAHKDINMAMIYDSFTITVLVTLESLGFCKKGEGGAFVASGARAPGGALPINTDGGGLSSNRPGRRGMFALIEGVRQLRGTSPGVNLPGARTCLVHRTGGFLSATATLILGV